MWTPRRTPHTTVSTVSSTRVAVSPSDSTNDTTATSAKPSPHATSTRSARARATDSPKINPNSPTMAAALTPRLTSTSSAMCDPLPHRGHAAEPVDPCAHRDDLVHAHPVLLEGQRSPGQVEPPPPGLLAPDERHEVRPPLVQCGQPGPAGADVVLPHRVHVADLEAGLGEVVQGGPHRPHGHVRGDVVLDERTTTGRHRAARHLLEHEPPARRQRAVERRRVLGIVLLADVLAYFHPGHGVVGP